MIDQIAERKATPKVNMKNLKSNLSYFYQWESQTPQNMFLRQPKNGQWKEYTWKEAGKQIRSMANALTAMNLPPQSNIGLVSKNCAHWVMSDLAIMMAGHISVPFYPTLNDEKIHELLVHSECKVLFVGKLDHWDSMRDGIPKEVHCITFPDSPAEKEGFARWDTLVAANDPLEESPVYDMEQLCTIIYTSGTTGTPKGVMHSYYTISYTVAVAALLMPFTNRNRFFSYLPLCHIAERQIVEVASLYSGGSISFVESIDTFATNLAEVQPTHFLAVPRIWTKFQQGVFEKMPPKRLNFLLSLPVISGIVKKKIKKRLGLGSAEQVLTGAAPMPDSLLKWYKRLGIIIQEAYGMTENVGCCTIMPVDKIKSGTVGKPYPECQLDIVPETQEIIMKSEWIMKGYYKEPGLSAKCVKDGWLYTGDMGEIDEDGYLKITGRVKDQFKCAKGEFIVPGPIEEAFVTNTDIEQVCVLGRGLPQPVTLVVLSEIGQQNSNEQIKNSLETTLKEVNSPPRANYERVQKVIVMKEAWTVENHILTPTLKIKRNVLEQLYQQKLEKWYKKKDTIIWE